MAVKLYGETMSLNALPDENASIIKTGLTKRASITKAIIIAAGRC
ncbi:MAG: hypothetical protein ACE5HI_14655 [bacterium]